MTMRSRKFAYLVGAVIPYVLMMQAPLRPSAEPYARLRERL
jgi:hypothetical protein